MRPKKVRLEGLVLAAALTTAAAVSVGFAEDVRAENDAKAEKIARARSAAPPAVSQEATIVDVDGTVLERGRNGWTCMPGIAPGDDHPMCNDAVWTSLMQAVAAKSDFQTDRIGISYMLQGDARVNNADPFDTEPDPGEVWIQEGPHLMIVVPDVSMLQGISDDPSSGQPYVMWKGTPYVHIMVPTAPRGESN